MKKETSERRVARKVDKDLTLTRKAQRAAKYHPPTLA